MKNETVKKVILYVTFAFMVSFVCTGINIQNGYAQSDDEFFDEDFDEEFDEDFDEDDDLFAMEEDEKVELKEPAKKKPKKKAKKKKKKEKKKVVKKEVVPEFNDDDDLFNFDDEDVDEKSVVKEAKQKTEEKSEMKTLKVYMAKKNDTLYSIAEMYYGTPDRWEEIWEHNKYIKDPTVVNYGDSIIVPVRVLDLKEETVVVEEVGGKIVKKLEQKAFVAGEIDYDGSIISFKDTRLLLPVAGNTVFLDIGSDDKVKPGVLYTIYREEGDYARKVGIVRITADVSETDAAALIVSSIEPIEIGDFVSEKP